MSRKSAANRKQDVSEKASTRKATTTKTNLTFFEINLPRHLCKIIEILCRYAEIVRRRKVDTKHKHRAKRGGRTRRTLNKKEKIERAWDESAVSFSVAHTRLSSATDDYHNQVVDDVGRGKAHTSQHRCWCMCVYVQIQPKQCQLYSSFSVDFSS